MNENKMLKYFWKFLGITFLIEILWYLICFSIGYFYFPTLMRHISMVGFLIIPFFTSYHTMWKQIEELEAFAEAKAMEEMKEKELKNKNDELRQKVHKKKQTKKKKEELIKDAVKVLDKKEKDSDNKKLNFVGFNTDVKNLNQKLNNDEDEEEF